MKPEEEEHSDPHGHAATIRSDLRHFSNPGEAIHVSPVDDTGHSYLVEWSLRGRSKSGIVTFSDSPPSINDPNLNNIKRYLGYKSFLASTDVADLFNVAKNTLNVIAPDEFYIESYATVNCQVEETVGSQETLERTESLIDEMLLSKDRSGTLIPFLTAPAGVGKTTVLKNLVRKSAQRFADGSQDYLWIYVNAQGKRLANLNDAMASYLDDIRADFSYSAISVLVRNEVVALVVDGFDELLGTAESYEEAFGSLTSFVDELEGQGVVIAAARSAYYEQEFRSRAGKVVGFDTGSWDLRIIELQGWNESQQRAFAEKRAAASGVKDPASLLEAILDLLDSPDIADLRSRPFFVSRLVDLEVKGGLSSQSSEGVFDRLVDGYLEREVSEKLIGPDGPYITKDRLRLFYGELAEEMWSQEARELSRANVRDFIDLLTEDEISSDARKIVAERTPYSAVLTKGSTPGSVAFEHELYFSYFLTSSVASSINAQNERRVRLSLRRGQLPDNAARMLIPRVSIGTEEILELLSSVSSDKSPDEPTIRANAGSVASEYLLKKNSLPGGLVIRKMDFFDASFEGVKIESAKLFDCQFVGVSFIGTQVTKSSAENVSFSRLLVDSSSTRMEIDGVFLRDVSGVRDASDSNFSYDFRRTRRLLGLIGLVNEESVRENFYDVDDSTYSVVEAFADIFRRTNIFAETDQYGAEKLVGLDGWGKVKDSALWSGVLREKGKKPASGSKNFYQLHALPSDIIRGRRRDEKVPENVKNFWAHLERAEKR